MANTYTQIYIQFVFAVQNRISLIQPAWKEDLYKYITGIVQSRSHKLIAINGMPDHLHVFVGYKPQQLIPELLQDIKGSSSLWINERHLVKGKFKWQEGYGAFSYSSSQIDRVVKYIMNQEQHHHKRTFAEEYVELLKKFKVDYNEKYLLWDVQ
jgi:REP element-mobilizing transposase RayT